MNSRLGNDAVLALSDRDRRIRLRSIASRLTSLYGHRRWRSHGPPLDELVSTVLSQHTSDINTARAFASLRETFSTWQDVVDAPTSDVAEAIRGGGLANLKAPRIQNILRAVESESGSFSLDWLTSGSLDEARDWLRSLPGVGPKTAACVLLFSLGLPAMPVDTHVHRVSRRLGLIDPGASADDAHAALDRLIGPDRDATYALHLNLIQHGRTVCKSRVPACEQCVLSDLCPSSRTAAAGVPTQPTPAN